MPDWTYVPLRKSAIGLLGSERRAQRAALALISGVARLPGGPKIIRAFDYTHDHEAAAVEAGSTSYPSPIGAVVPVADETTATVFRSMGFGFVAEADGLPSGATVSSATTIDGLIAELDAGTEGAGDSKRGVPLLAANAAVIELGPTVAQRVNEVLAQRANEAAGYEPEAVQWLKPWTWQAWVWALWLGIAMICGGIGASIIALGPVVLGYDQDFLGANLDELREINDQLVAFLQHDRITMAGCMMAIGFNDIGFALGMRRGWRWARAGFAVAGAVGFPTFFLFLGYRFFDPLHFAVAVGFFPLYLGGVFGRQADPTWRVPVVIDEEQRRRALLAQLLMVAVAVGVFLSGFVIMSIGLRDVLIPSDRVFLDAEQQVFAEALDGRLLRFIAHDRAGFGGALASLGAGLLTTTLWGWRWGERSTWIMLAAASIVGFGAALIVHIAVGYTDFVHLLPVYLGMAMLTYILAMSRRWFFAGHHAV